MSDKPIKISVRLPEGATGWGEDTESLESENERVIAELVKRRRSKIEKHGTPNDPLYRVLYHPRSKAKVKPPTKEGREALTRDFREAGDKKALTNAKLPSGAGSWLRRTVPKQYKKGAELLDPTEAKKGGYKPGPYMTRSEAGATGEALIFLNPQLRSVVEKYYGGPMSMPEGMNIEYGRVENSPFDFYVGTTGVELKTVSLTTGRQALKVTNNRDSNVSVDRLTWSRQNGVTQSVMSLVIDQKSGRAHILAYEIGDDESIDGKSLSFARANVLTPAGGIKITDQDIYEAYWVSSQPMPLRVLPDGGYQVETITERGKKYVVPVGTLNYDVMGSGIDGKTYLGADPFPGDKMKYGE